MSVHKRKFTAYTSCPLDCMPFGKYKDVPIEEVPFSYLEYVVNEFSSEEKPDVYDMCENELIRRKTRG